MDQEKRTILLVDDDVTTRKVYREFLEEAGFTIIEAGNGSEALTEVNIRRPDLVFTGIDMPEMDGFTLVESLKERQDMKDLPILFLSHHGRPEDEARGQSLGVKDFIIRDITTPREVIRRVKNQLVHSSYHVAVTPDRYDADGLAHDYAIPADFLHSENGEKKEYVLKLIPKDKDRKTFEAELVNL
jgi:PleD family two-component response regulator